MFPAEVEDRAAQVQNGNSGNKHKKYFREGRLDLLSLREVINSSQLLLPPSNFRSTLTKAREIKAASKWAQQLLPTLMT